MRLRRLAAILAVSLLVVVGPPKSAIAASPQPSVELDAASMGPREIEDLTEKKILRDYGEAWKSLAAALENNRPGLLNEYFTGFAKTAWTKAVVDQRATGVHRRYQDHGHRLEGLFYSQDGGVMQLRDTASYEVQVFDGDRLLYSEPKTDTFVVIMTPAADRWMVRLLQGEPHPQK
jgi:hypothetical protein